MEQLISTMLANTQIPQAAPAVKKDGSSAQKDGFQKLLEQKQTDASQASRPEKADAAPQKPQESQGAQQEARETEEQPQAALKEDRELEERMALAAMAAMQAPVTPVEQALTPEAQAEAAADAPLAAEAVLAPQEQSFAPEAEARSAEVPVEEGGSETVSQAPAEELPQAIEAPEASQNAQERTVEVKAESGGGEARDAEAAPDTEETPDFQGAEAEAPVFEDVKAVPVKVGEAPRAAEDAETESIGRQIGSKLIGITSVSGEAGGQSVTIDLDPANLGRLQIEVGLSKDGTLYVHVNAENGRTQNLLSRNSESLAAILGKYTQQEVRVEVPRQEESQRQDLYEQQQEHHQHRQQEQRQKHETRSEDFLQQLRLGLIPLDGE